MLCQTQSSTGAHSFAKPQVVCKRVGSGARLGFLSLRAHRRFQRVRGRNSGLQRVDDVVLVRHPGGVERGVLVRVGALLFELLGHAAVEARDAAAFARGDVGGFFLFVSHDVPPSLTFPPGIKGLAKLTTAVFSEGWK